MKNFETYTSKYKLVVTNTIMIIGFISYSCEDENTDINDTTDFGLVINEINYHSSDSYDSDDWIEIYNNSNNTVNMDSWVLKDENDEHIFIIAAHTEILPGQYLVFCSDTLKFAALFPDIESYYGNLGFGLGKGGDIVRLFDSNGLLVDMVEYDDTLPWPIQADGNGATLELINPFLDNSISKNWSASEGNGTPGTLNSVYSDND